MNEIEQKAYKWFLNQGFKAEQIDFNPKRTVDFIVNGEPFEAKRLHEKNMIMFTPKQLREFKKINPTILVFNDSSKSPIAVTKFSELKKQFKIQPTTRSRLVHVWVDPDLLEEYREYKPETKGLTYTALVDMIVRERLVELQKETGERKPHRSSGKNVKISPSIH